MFRKVNILFIYNKYGLRAPVKMPPTIPLIFTVLLIFLLNQKPEGQGKGKMVSTSCLHRPITSTVVSFSAAPFLTFPIVVRKLFL